MGYILGKDNKISLIMPDWHTGEYDLYEIVVNDSNEVVGNIKFHYELDKVIGNVEYFVFEEYRNKGYAKRALKLLAKNVYKLDETDLFISILPDNTASIKVALSAGAVLEKKVEIPHRYIFGENGKYKYANMYIIKDKNRGKSK